MNTLKISCVGAALIEKKTIKITCKGATALELDQFIPLQGNLKTLDKADYKKLRNLIIELGFSDPIAIWRDGGKHLMLNGHQRVATIKKMVAEEGWDSPALPVVLIDAADIHEAKKKLLAMSSQFGRIEEDGLYNFIQDMGVTDDYLLEGLSFSDFSMRDFVDTYRLDPTPVLDDPFNGPSPLAPSGDLINPGKSGAPDTLSNTKNYLSNAEKLNNYLGSEVRRITIFLNPNDYGNAIAKMAAISLRFEFKDYKEVLFYLLNNYDNDQQSKATR